MLEHAQELRLHVERKLANLVEEHCAAVGSLDGTLARGAGAGEGTTGMSEELALEQIVGEGRAVHDDVRSRSSRRCFVNRTTDDLFARTGLTADEDGDVGPRDARERGKELTHRVALAEERTERRFGPELDAGSHSRRNQLDMDLGRPEAERLARCDARRLHLHAIDERAVAAVEIAYPRSARIDVDLGVHPRDGWVRDADVHVVR